VRRRCCALAVPFALFLAACGSSDPKVASGPRTSAGDSSPVVVTEPGTPDTTEPVDSAPDTSEPTTTDAPVDAGTIDWGACDIENADPDAECGTLSVPLDYDAPDGERIDISLVRIAAGKESKRIGSILFNPGGPGGSGVDMVALQVGPQRTLRYPELGDKFDLIGFDPRGVDRSNGIRCVDDAWQEKYRYIDSTPDTPDEEVLVDEQTTTFVAACQTTYGDSLIEYDTANTARDMDQIRAALGDEKLTYYGVSYGTILGAVYATLFPDNVRALVLDSAYDPQGIDSGESAIIQFRGFEGAFANWVTWCEANEGCPFGNTDVDARWTALRDLLDATPVPADDGRLANRDVMVLATISALYSNSSWPQLAVALGDAEAGDGTGLYTLADSYNGREADGTWATIQQSNPVIGCASGLAIAPAADPEATATEIAAVSPHFIYETTADDWDSGCDGLPEGSIPETTYAGSGPILVIGGLNDPATPFEWAEKMSASLSAELLTFTGEGHGAFFESSCVVDAAVDVLVSGEPSDVTTCEPDEPLARPEWFDGLSIPAGFEPIDLLGAEELLGLDPATMYATSFVTSSATATDDLSAALADGDWNEAQRAPLEIDGATDGEQVVFIGSDGALAALVLGPTTLGLPDLAAFSGLVPDGQTLVVLIAI
jgi:pimeloyl-ACP methyl ester carboxylesterase